MLHHANTRRRKSRCKPLFATTKHQQRQSRALAEQRSGSANAFVANRLAYNHLSSVEWDKLGLAG